MLPTPTVLGLVRLQHLSDLLLHAADETSDGGLVVVDVHLCGNDTSAQLRRLDAAHSVSELALDDRDSDRPARPGRPNNGQ